jgi:hypothetical protein
MEKLTIPYFAKRADLFNFLIENKDRLLAQKKMEIKHADAFSSFDIIYDKESNAIKAGSIDNVEATRKLIDMDEFLVKVAINTTNLFDSHKDVHIPGIWKKTLSEKRMLFHLQEHKMGFSSIIADGKDLKVYVKRHEWKELGLNYKGETEVLTFESVVKKQRNPYMHEQYAKGYVRNHSVGMGYVNLIMCINEEKYGAEYEAWEKYFSMIANAEEAEESGYFWAVKEAKAYEGSAVPLGSNWATPTLSVSENKTGEPDDHSSTNKNEEPAAATQEIDYKLLTQKIANLKF